MMQRGGCCKHHAKVINTAFVNTGVPFSLSSKITFLKLKNDHKSKEKVRICNLRNGCTIGL